MAKITTVQALTPDSNITSYFLEMCQLFYSAAKKYGTAQLYAYYPQWNTFVLLLHLFYQSASANLK